MKLDGRAAIVTGGSSGLGEAIVNTLLNAGATVYNFDMQPPQNASKSTFVKLDVTSEEEVTKAVEAIELPIYVLVNSAGIGGAQRIASNKGVHSYKMFQKVVNVNLMGTFNVARIVAQKMIKQDPLPLPDSTEPVQKLVTPERGVIINLASIAAFEGEGGQVAYSASKGGVVGMTLPAARDLRRFGVRFLTVAPGLIKTPLAEKGLTPEVEKAISRNILFPQRLGHPDEVAALIMHIIGNAYLNGTTIRVDAGVRLSSL